MKGNLGGRQVNLSLMYMHAAVELKEKDNVYKCPNIREMRTRTQDWPLVFLRVTFYWRWHGWKVWGTVILIAESTSYGYISSALEH